MGRSGMVLTAKHVPQDSMSQATEQGWTELRIVIGIAQTNTENMRANFTLVGGEVVEDDARHDLTLLRMMSNPFEGGVSSGIVIGGTPVPLLFQEANLSPERPPDGTAIAVSGYHLSETIMVTTRRAIASSWGIDLKDVPMPGHPDGFTWPDTKDSYLADVSVNPGTVAGLSIASKMAA